MSVSDGKLNCTSAYTLQCQIILWWHPYTSSYFQESFHRWAGVCRMCLAIPELYTKHMACNNICKMLLRVDRASLSKETAACRQMKITGGSRLLAFGEPQNMARSLAASTNMTQNMLSIILIYSKQLSDSIRSWAIRKYFWGNWNYLTVFVEINQHYKQTKCYY